MSRLSQTLFAFCLCVAWMFTSASYAQKLEPELLRKLKAATVFIHCETHNDMPQGSGCFIEPNLIVTTARVLRLGNGVEPKSISVIVNSGQPDEKELAAELVAYNAPGNLAFIRISPQASFTSRDFLAFSSSADLRETQGVYLAGYPLGTALSDAKNPTITVAPATISSFRRNALGSVELIQIDGNLIPGNSGGPLVDAKGRVVGIAESMVIATQIGFAIPSDNVQLDLDGRFAEMKLTNVYRQDKQYSFELEVRACDPKRNLKQVAIQYWIGKAGATRPKDPKMQFPIYGATGDGPKQLVKLQRAANDATGQRWTAEVKDFEFQGAGEFWAQAGYSGKSGRFTTVASVNQTRALIAAKAGTKPPAPREAANGPVAQTKGNGAFKLGERVPPELVPQVSPFPEDAARRIVIEDNGVPWLTSSVDKLPMANIAQVASSPSGDAVYIVLQNGDEVQKYDPLDYAKPVTKVKVAAGADSVWCDSKRVVVGCSQAGKVVFLSPDLQSTLKEVTLPNLVPHTIVGRAPDNSVISVWRDKDKADEQYSIRQVVLIDEVQEPRFVGKGEVEHACFCFEDKNLLIQQFRGGPVAAPKMIEIATEQKKNISQLSTLPFKFHNDFFHIFSTFDGKSLVMPHATQQGAQLGPIETSLVAPNLRSVELSFDGAAFAEDPVNQWLIAIDSQATKQGARLPAVTFVNRETGKAIRGILGLGVDLHPATYRIASSKSTFAYVPGHQQVLFWNDKTLHVMSCALFEKETPIDQRTTMGSTVEEAMANVRRLAEQQRKAEASAEKNKQRAESKRENETKQKILGSTFGAKLAARFRGAKPLPVIQPTATSIEGEPIKARRVLDKSGQPVTVAQSDPEVVNLGEGKLLQVIADPTGEKLYAIFDQRATISVIDTKTLSAVGEIAVPQYPVSMAFNGAALVVACDKSAVVAFVDTASAAVTASVKVKETESHPKYINGPAPDGSSITIWSDNSIYLVHPDKPPLFLLRHAAQWCTFPAGPRHVWLQGDFTHYPSGTLALVDTTKQQASEYIPPASTNKDMFGRKDLDMHRDCGISFPSNDRTRFIVPVSMFDFAQKDSKTPTRTLILRPDLSEVTAELPGAVIHEIEATDTYVAWNSLDVTQSRSGIEILYISRSNGRIYRRVQVQNMPGDLRNSPVSSPLPHMIYVPGRELFIIVDPQAKRPSLHVVRCGPIADGAATAPDPTVKSKNAPPQVVYVGKPKTFKPELTFPAKFKGSAKFRIKQGIPGVTIDESTGEITFAPKASHLGKYEIQIVAEADGQTIPVLSWVLEVDLP